MRAVRSVEFLEDGSVLIVYMDPTTDVRNRNLLVHSHQLHVARGDTMKDYGDEIDDVTDAVKRLLDDALEDWNNTAPTATSSSTTSNDDNER